MSLIETPKKGNDMHYKEYNVRVYPNEKIEWRNKDGKLHREDGPARIYPRGDVEYWINGQRHRDDGPAVMHFNGDVEYYLNGKYLTKKQFNERKNPHHGKIIEVDGKKYKLVFV